jgi:dTDP-4-amino-4,6-dideoxygalactose transaminase
MEIPFNKPYHFALEEQHVIRSLRSGSICGNREYGVRAARLLEEKYGIKKAFLTPSCTSALEMGVILANLQPGDEVILPSYTFSSTANAVVLQGGKPVFCEVDPATMNIDVSLIEALITDKTRMILPIDYAGIPCEIERIGEIARKHGLTVLQDAAQSIHSTVSGKCTGSLAPLVAFSFHETKNVSCGEGGALCVNDEALIEKAHFVQEKGTDRSLVLCGVKDKYTWVSKGSSFLLSDILAAVLLSQLEHVEIITAKRSFVTRTYSSLFGPYARAGCLQIAEVPPNVSVNHHAFFVTFDTEGHRAQFLNRLKSRNIHAYIGYVPLHSSPMGRSYGYRPEDLSVTESISRRIVRLPLYTELCDEGLDYCLEGMSEVLYSIYGIQSLPGVGLRPPSREIEDRTHAL